MAPSANAAAELLAIARRLFAPYWNIPTVRFCTAFETMAAWFVETESRRREDPRQSREVTGDRTRGPVGPVTFTARADRIDSFVDGGRRFLITRPARAKPRCRAAAHAAFDRSGDRCSWWI